MDNNQLVDVVKTLKKTELVFGTNNCTLRVGKSDVKVEDQDGDELISIYPEIREREYRVLYSSPTLNKHGTSTAQELVDFWELNNFFFDVGSQVIADGRVEFRADLPITIGFPAVGAIYFVEQPTLILGVWKQYTSGDYIKDTDTGSLSDWIKTNKKSRFTTSEFRVLDNVDQSKQLAFNLSNFITAITRTFTWPDKDGTVFMAEDDDKQALISFRKVVGQLVTDLSTELDNIITFPIANPMPTAPTVLDFDGTILSILQRHPTKNSRILYNFVLTNSSNSAVNVTVNIRASIDGGLTYPVIANTETFPMLPKSGGDNASSFPSIGEWISDQPSLVPVFVKVQVFADITNVVTVEPGSTLNLDGRYK
jgi:hypothetical protein